MDNKDRLNRLLLQLPWLKQNRNVTIKDFAKTFNITQEQAIGDLTLLTFVGPSQFGGDLVDIQIIDEYITLIDSQNHNVPLKLTPEDLMVLMISINLLIQTDPTNLIARNVLHKINYLFESNQSQLDSNLSNIIETVQNCLNNKKQIFIDYINGRNIVSKDSKISPLSIIEVDGYKYLQGYEEESKIKKDYRIDRILHAKMSTDSIKIYPDSSTKKYRGHAKITFPIWLKSVIENFNLIPVKISESDLQIDFDYFDIDFIKTLIYRLGKNIKINDNKTLKNELISLVDHDIQRFQ